jgi:molybdenum cofactor guanylyltransferase
MARESGLVGAILAGGRSSRMGGGDKCLRLLGGRPLLAHVLERLRPQVDATVLNVNGDPARFAAFGLAVAPDTVPGFAGPLAGVLAALEWSRRHRPNAAYVLSAPADSPFLPSDLAVRLLALGAPLARARSGGRAHPVAALWSVALADDLRQAVESEGVRKIEAWTARHRCAEAEWPVDAVDPFFNVNTPEDLAEAERLLPPTP